MKITQTIPQVFEPLLADARYKACWGGRGSGKSYFFAWQIVKKALKIKGFRGVCIREVQLTLKESSKRLIESLLLQHNLGKDQGFEVLHDQIKTPHGGSILFIGMNNNNAESIKSLEGIDVAWVEEAQSLSARSLSLLRPTIRKNNSELWFSFNPRRKSDIISQLFLGEELPTNSIVVRANWSDNPFFPTVLEQERLDCLKLQPEQYNHIWEGGFATILVGAYYAKHINECRLDNRITKLSLNTLLPIKVAIDIGGTGAKSDSFVMVVFQNVGKSIHILDHYEAVGQDLSAHLEWLRLKGYTQNNTQIYLPHDGANHDKVYSVSYQSAFQDVGYDVTVIPNQGTGAAMARIECVRRNFKSMWFNEQTTQPCLEALGWYHSKQDDNRQVDLGPEHDWSSHTADAVGLMAIVSEDTIKASEWLSSKIDYSLVDRINII